MKEKNNKYKKGKLEKPPKDYIKFLNFKKDKSKTKRNKKDAWEWLFGNSSKFFKKGSFRKTEQFEFKYWAFLENKTSNHEPKIQCKSKEYTFILRGHIRGKVDGEDIDLKTGDYIVIEPGVVNNLVGEVLEDTLGITIKAPSSEKDDDTVKIKKEDLPSDFFKQKA